MFGASRQFLSSIQNEHIFLGATRLFLPILSPVYGTVDHQNRKFSLAPLARLILCTEQSDHFAPQARTF